MRKERSMPQEFSHEEVLQTLTVLIARNTEMLENEEGEFEQVRTNLLALTVKEHIVGTLTEEERHRYESALSRFRDLRARVDSQRAALSKLRAAREDWESGLPGSLQDRFRDLLTS
jgi:hypothetical protein